MTLRTGYDTFVWGNGVQRLASRRELKWTAGIYGYGNPADHDRILSGGRLVHKPDGISVPGILDNSGGIRGSLGNGTLGNCI